MASLPLIDRQHIAGMLMAQFLSFVDGNREEASLSPLTDAEKQQLRTLFNAEIEKAADAMYREYERDGELEELRNPEGDWLNEFLNGRLPVNLVEVPVVEPSQ